MIIAWNHYMELSLYDHCMIIVWSLSITGYSFVHGHHYQRRFFDRGMLLTCTILMMANVRTIMVMIIAIIPITTTGVTDNGLGFKISLINAGAGIRYVQRTTIYTYILYTYILIYYIIIYLYILCDENYATQLIFYRMIIAWNHCMELSLYVIIANNGLLVGTWASCWVLL